MKVTVESVSWATSPIDKTARYAIDATINGAVVRVVEVATAEATAEAYRVRNIEQAAWHKLADQMREVFRGKT